MKQLTLRGIEGELELRLLDLSRREGISLNQAVLRLLRKATGLDAPSHRDDVIGSALDRFIGTWSAEEARQVNEAAEDFERIDESLWR